MIGFGILGFGLSVIVPEIFRLAGRNKTLSASVAVSTVSGVGFVGFMVGPVFLGVISNIMTLVYSYITLFFSVLIAWGLVVIFRIKKY